MTTERNKEHRPEHAAPPQAWHERPELLAAMSRLAKIGAWEFDPATGQGVWTEEVARIHDLDPTQPANVQFGLSFYPGESRRKIEQAVREACEVGKPYDLELEFISAKGARKWVRTVGIPVKEGPRVTKVWGTLQDISEYRQTAAALRESELRFRELYEHSPDAVFVENINGVVMDVNPAACRLHGMPREKLLGKNVLELVPAEQRELVRSSFSRWFSGQLTSFEGTSYTVDGRAVPVSIRGALISYRGQPAVLLHVRDITEQKAAAAKLLEQAETLSRLAANVPGILFQFVVRTDGTQGFSYISETCRALLGVEPAAVLADPYALINLVHPDERAAFDQTLATAIQTKSAWRWEGRARAKGRELWWQGASTPRTLPNGDTIWAGVLMDITAHKQIATELARSREDWEHIFQAIGDPAFILDPQHNFLEANKALLEATGKTLEELRRHKCWEIFHGPREQSPHLNCPMEALRESGHKESREVYLKALGSTHLVSCTPVFNAEGQLEKIIHITSDISELKRLQRDLLQAQKMETVGQLAGGIAHDFNNILQTILGYAELLLKSTDKGDERYTDLREIQRSGERAAALTRQLLAFSRRQMLMPTVLDLNALITNFSQMLSRIISENITLKLELARDLGRVRVDAAQLEQVLLNLAVNARDALPQGGQITIRTRNIALDVGDVALHPEARTGQFVCLHFGDNGTGMTREVREKVFEPFFTTKKGTGTGMGLATVYGIIKQHEGWIHVYSEPGQGTEFKIYLPALAVPVTTPPLTPIPPSRPPLGRGELILFVEDDVHARRQTEQMLLKSGYQVNAVGTCAEARAQCHDRVKVLFSDVVLPDGNGLDLVRELQTRHPALRCVLASGYADIHERWPEIAEKGWPFLVKPFKQVDLLRALAVALNHSAVT
jgi:PAS domain S-box-containing protein